MRQHPTAVVVVVAVTLAMLAAVSLVSAAVVPSYGAGVALPSDKAARLAAPAAAQSAARAHVTGANDKAQEPAPPQQTDPPLDVSAASVAGIGYLFVSAFRPLGQADENVTTRWVAKLRSGDTLTVWAGSLVGRVPDLLEKL